MWKWGNPFQLSSISWSTVGIPVMKRLQLLSTCSQGDRHPPVPCVHVYPRTHCINKQPRAPICWIWYSFIKCQTKLMFLILQHPNGQSDIQTERRGYCASDNLNVISQSHRVTVTSKITGICSSHCPGSNKIDGRMERKSSWFTKLLLSWLAPQRRVIKLK